MKYYFPFALSLLGLGGTVQKRWSVMDRLEMLRGVARRLIPEYRFKWPQLDWWHNEAFTAYLRRFQELDNLNTDRRWMLHQLLRLVEGVPGDTAECGVYAGASSYLICQANAQCAKFDREHFLFDSFEGLSTPNDTDGSHWQRGDLSISQKAAEQNLAEFTRTHYLTGWIPDRFSEVRDRSFCFVHVDVDLAEPTCNSVQFFYDRLSPGGILLCDDYACTTCPGATKAIDEFLAEKPEKMIALDAGGGFFIKGCQTAPAAEPKLKLAK